MNDSSGLARTDVFSQSLSSLSDQWVVLMMERDALAEAHRAAEARVVDLERQLEAARAAIAGPLFEAAARVRAAVNLVNAAIASETKDPPPIDAYPARSLRPLPPPAAQDRAGLSPTDRTDPTFRPAGSCEVSPPSQRERPA